jgi:hypothetical protein
MWLAEKRRIRDRTFIPYDQEKHFKKAYIAGCISYDLFPPVKGYRIFNSKAKRSYNVSPKRQHADWADLIKERDGRQCQECKSIEHLEAHHIWPQSSYNSLRYVVRNGITLCRSCHDLAYFPPEITPGQFLELTSDQPTINSIVEAPNFWDYYVAGAGKGKLLAYGLCTKEEMSMTDDELNYFLELAKLNNFASDSKRSSIEAPIRDSLFSISSEIEDQISNYCISW